MATEDNKAIEEAEIRRQMDGWARALRAKDIDGVMSFYAPNIVSFDLDPPLRYAGADNKRRAWQELFAAYTGPIAYEVHDLNVTTHGELAFVHSLNHANGTLASGHTADMWVRWTACFRRIGGVWLVVHDHVSVPADLESGKAVLDLNPSQVRQLRPHGDGMAGASSSAKGETDVNRTTLDQRPSA